MPKQGREVISVNAGRIREPCFILKGRPHAPFLGVINGGRSDIMFPRLKQPYSYYMYIGLEGI